MRTHNSSPLRFWFSTLLAGAALGLAGCGGSNKDHHGDNDHDHSHDHDQRGRLIFSTTNNSNLGVFDQAQNTPGFLANGFTRNGNAGSELILNHDGLSIAVLDGTELTILSSGLEHLNGHSSAHGHSHDIKDVGVNITNVDIVIPTQGYFSILKTDGSSYLIAPDGDIDPASDSNVVYPSLLLAGDDRLTFSAAGSNTVANIVDMQGNALATPISFTCDAIKQTVQTFHMVATLCNNGRVYLIASEHSNNKYQHSEIELSYTNIAGLLIANSEDDTIAAYNTNQLYLITAHGNHIHDADASSKIATTIEQAVALTDSDTLAVLGNNGNITFVNFDVDHGTPNIKEASTETINGSNISTENLSLVAGAETLWVINKVSGELYRFDAHDDHFHQHDTYQHDDLKALHSVVFAHYIETIDDHDDDDHDDHNH